MNKRIDQLAEQCRFEIQGINCEVLGQGFDEERFAELIVRECLEQIHIQSRGPCGDYHGEWYESDILKHFGVDV